MAMMISWVMPVNPSHPYLENDPAPSFAPTICAFHLGFSLEENSGLLSVESEASRTFTGYLWEMASGPSLEP